MSASDRDDFTGRRIGHYAVERCLGKGGMGAVYLARDLTLERPAAIKLLLNSITHQPGIVERFQREAKAAAGLAHPNIVQVYGVGFEEDPPYIAMEFVDGTPLDAFLRQRGPVPWQQALNIVGQISAALDCAHQKGIVHRDIKPANILIDKQGRARVTDFGIAKVAQAETQLTATGTFVGTPQYMSPEHCGRGAVGPQSDLFSLGVTAYELLSGRLPFGGDTPASLVFQITHDTPEPLASHVPGIPASVNLLIERLLAKDLSTRYQSAQELLADIRRVLAGEPLMAVAATTPLGTPESSPRGLTQVPPQPGGLGLSRRRLAIVAGVLAAVLAIAVGGWAMKSRKKPLDASQAPVAISNEEASEEFPIIDEVFAVNDVDRDGILHGTEIPRQLRRMATRADTDGDGGLSREEMEQARERWEESVTVPGNTPDSRRFTQSDPDPASLMRRFDTDKNQRLKPSELPESMRPRLREADTNKDGEVTMDELRASAAQAAASGPGR